MSIWRVKQCTTCGKDCSGTKCKECRDAVFRHMRANLRGPEVELPAKAKRVEKPIIKHKLAGQKERERTIDGARRNFQMRKKFEKGVY